MSNEVSVRFSRKVTIVSFLLSIFVMYIHANKLVCNFADTQGSPVYILDKMIAGTIGRVGVPFFFLQSGYWMFRFDIFEAKSDTLYKKLTKKLYSLGVPFLLWNTFGLFFFLIVTRIPGLSAMIHEGRVVPVTLTNILEGIFLHKFYIVFWFMQDLIVLTALSPVLISLLRRRYLTYAAIGILLILSVMNVNPPVCQSSSLLLFTTGGALAVYHRGYWEDFSGNYREAGIHLALFIVFAVIKWLSIPYLSTVSVIVSPILFWKSCDLLIPAQTFAHDPPWFFRQSFFVYAAHDFLVEALSAVLPRVSGNMVWICVSYVATPLIVLAILYVAARVLDRRLPKFYRLLCGGRG